MSRDYKETLNLPKTDFAMKTNLPQVEPQVLQTWQKIGLYKKMQEKNKDGPLFILHDGPPYANGHVHLGTALNRVLKDVVIKYKSMRGYNVPFVPGWDCHGLPVEFQLFKELGVNKHEISRENFRIKAAAYARNFVQIQKNEFQRLGLTGDWEAPYLTLDPQYEGRVINVFMHLAKNGCIYRGRRPVYWCVHCETALAEAEVEYKNKSSSSLYVKFPLVDAKGMAKLGLRQPAHMIIWTTTAWTLPANVAIAVHPEHEYIFVEMGREVYVVARLPWEKGLREKIKDPYRIIAAVKGKELEGISCRHPFWEKQVKVICAAFVSMEEGTGLVHIAPGHGEEDYEIGRLYNLEVLSPVNERGKFTAEAPSFLKGKAVLAQETNAEIIEYLRQKGLLWDRVRIMQHSYPYCWRCSTPLIFRATEQWFLSLDKGDLRKKTLEAIKKVRWFPVQGESRIRAMLESRPDWCLSRQRYWGIPLPIFYCENCGEALLSPESIKAVELMISRQGSDAWYTKEASEILPPGMKCPSCAKERFRKEEDIFDVWFDSSCSFAAVLKERKELSYPADLYLEGSDQHRGWFQHSLIASMGSAGECPFKGVLTHGFVVDGEGKKMSKSMGNVVMSEEFVNKYGAEILRLWVTSQDSTVDVRYSDKITTQIVEVYRKIRNTSRFILGNLQDFSKDREASYCALTEIDRLLLSKLQGIIEEVTLAYERFEFHRAVHLIYNFCVRDLSAFYLDILKDRLYTFAADSLPRRSAQTVLEKIILVTTKLISPILFYTAEELWSCLKQKEESVFLADWPQVKDEYIDQDLEQRWKKVLALRDEVLRELEKKRNIGEIGNALEARVEIFAADKQAFDFLKNYEKDWPQIFIVSQAELNFQEGLKQEREIKELGKIAISVTKARGNKCQRCWNYSQSVGENTLHPQICNKCIAQLPQEDR